MDITKLMGLLMFARMAGIMMLRYRQKLVHAGRFGKAVFSCTAISYVNGAKRDEKKLQGGVNAVENVGWCNLGAATIILPPYGTNVEIDLEVGYVLYTAASMHGATNVSANWIYDNVWKKNG